MDCSSANQQANENETTSLLEASHSERPGSHWRVWTCIDTLKRDVPANPMMAQPYRSTTLQVAAILEQWGLSWAGDLTWASFLNKRSLHHEAEESIVALYHLREWMTMRMRMMTQEPNSKPEPFIAVDVCGGKGFFSMLLSYMTSDYWQPEHTEQENVRFLDSVVLIEKCTPDDIDWNHIHHANTRDKKHPEITIWSGTNLHEYDILVSRLQSLAREKKRILALTGIHLCKMLSPSLVSLANGLGCPYLCLAPCCLPRVVLAANSSKKQTIPQTIPIYLHESPQALEERLEHNRRKLLARNNHACFLCQKKRHWVKLCPELPKLSQPEQAKVIDDAIQKTPCWHCGIVGHFRADCPTPQLKITTRYPPTVEMDVSNIIRSNTPYEDYCQLLAGYIQLDGSNGNGLFGQEPAVVDDSNTKSNGVIAQPVTKLQRMSDKVQIVEAGLTGNKSGHDGNWNSRRKSIFLVATK